MTTATRFTIIGASLFLCVGGILIANSSLLGADGGGDSPGGSDVCP